MSSWAGVVHERAVPDLDALAGLGGDERLDAPVRHAGVEASTDLLHHVLVPSGVHWPSSRIWDGSPSAFGFRSVSERHSGQCG
jgi:hypothetical protein